MRTKIHSYDALPVSIVLSIYNKEKSIGPLLRTLWRSTRTYPNWDIHVIYDGCEDNTVAEAKKVLAGWTVPVYEYETPNIFEVRSNNLGLKSAKGVYCAIIQDDNYVAEAYWLEQMVAWMETHPKTAVLGGLAGVNFFPIELPPPGHDVRQSWPEVHQRLDWRWTPQLRRFVYEVDAVMRGPILFRKNLLEELGYLDEAYAPLFNDDMDYCFRVRKAGYQVFCHPINVENRNLTMAKYDPEKISRFDVVMNVNRKLFYERWMGDVGKHENYVKLPRWEAYPDPRGAFGRIVELGISVGVPLSLAAQDFRRKLRPLKRAAERLLKMKSGR